jgi:hypothetical protein
MSDEFRNWAMNTRLTGRKSRYSLKHKMVKNPCPRTDKQPTTETFEDVLDRQTVTGYSEYGPSYS